MSTNAKQQHSLRSLVEGAIMVAVAFALSFVEIPVGLYGGSIEFVMIPLIVYSLRRGTAWGLGAGLVFGTVKYFSTGWALNWASILLDYSIAYMAVGIAGMAKDRPGGYIWGPLAGCFMRFVIHFISGIVLYAEYMPEEFLGLTMTSLPLYSIIYNGLFMLPNTVIAIIVCSILAKPMKRIKL
ncbi:MAG: energy-coupled thiamine transporter ThiT [Clostridiales bacterium]|jgi:thiamine transporter|nr:energy-coupled thiamine transporter ThiT [Clostridiales bacterium]